ncbi:Caspase domain-containing protein [Paenibacillus sophorae]|uniref:Caspase domain-containing protein n=1 Tax=Paenibacillus sophorae TaxID=1333845 RepID=A0A1H8M706_9BACL|nr:caspase family protein [Paenibacillus sophorae]QWU17698.1 caspase family protein [Paenibacillus sophorae]SEO13139.1 Caspase domain-containing protein [Paenibacillus sophorae]
MSNGYSLHIGLNAVDPTHYAGWDGKLKGCENDAKAMMAIAQYRNYNNSTLLLTQQATIQNVTNEIKKAAEKLKSGDVFFLSYSGHGGSVADTNNDELDKKDETWCLYDGQFLDDELYDLWFQFKENVKIIVLSDSCHSGTVLRARFYGLSSTSNQNNKTYRFMPLEIVDKVFAQNREFYMNKKRKNNEHDLSGLKSSIKLISGCQDNQYSQDGEVNGLFTEKLLKVWNDGQFSGNYLSFYKSITLQMPPDQTPNYYNIGVTNDVFDNQSPFSINNIRSNEEHKKEISFV